MTKYRLRLKNSRVIGPFDFNQIHDLKSKGHIDGSEDAQVFPLGEWKAMSTFDFYENLMDENKTVVHQKNEDSTFVIDLSQIRQKITEKEIEELAVDPPPPTDHLTKTQQISTTKVSGGSSGNSAITISQEMDISHQNTGREDKTLINPVAQEEIRKMRKLQELMT
jgi:hypothetical protein